MRSSHGRTQLQLPTAIYVHCWFRAQKTFLGWLISSPWRLIRLRLFVDTSWTRPFVPKREPGQSVGFVAAPAAWQLLIWTCNFQPPIDDAQVWCCTMIAMWLGIAALCGWLNHHVCVCLSWFESTESSGRETCVWTTGAHPRPRYVFICVIYIYMYRLCS